VRTSKGGIGSKLPLKLVIMKNQTFEVRTYNFSALMPLIFITCEAVVTYYSEELRHCLQGELTKFAANWVELLLLTLGVICY
jgi:hypothetical protein